MGRAIRASEFIAEVAKRAHMDERTIRAVLTAVVFVTGEHLRLGNTVMIPGLVQLAPRQMPARPQRTVRKPGTDEMYSIPPCPAYRKVVIKMVKTLRDHLCHLREHVQQKGSKINSPNLRAVK